MNGKNYAGNNSELSGERLFLYALKLAGLPIIMSFILTPLRFLLELSGLPEYAIFIIGLLWLTLAFAVYWGVKLYKNKHSYLLLLLALIIFSPVSRLTVVAAWWVDKRWELGTHYGEYFDNLFQVLINHVLYGSFVQIIPGFILGSFTIALMRYRKK